MTLHPERLIIKNRAELIRTLKREGLVIRVVHHWQEHLANTTRTVQKAQTNGYLFYADDREGKRVRMWAEIPPASHILFGADGEITFHPGDDKSWTLTLEVPETHQHATAGADTMKHTRALKPTFKRGDLAAAEHEATTLHKDALAALTTERVCDVQDDVDLNDWKYEVMNGDTVLGFQEWVEHKIEANSPSLGRTDPEVYDVDDLRRKLTQGQN